MPYSDPLFDRDIAHVAKAATDALRENGFTCCLFGSAACYYYGMRNRTPNDVDIVVMEDPDDYDVEDIKQSLVDTDDNFFLVPAGNPRDTFKVLWYRLPRRNGSQKRCKVDILLPGPEFLSIPRLDSEEIYYTQRSRMPLIPLLTLILLKVRGWSNHRSDHRQRMQDKVPQDEEDLEEMLEIAKNKNARVENEEGLWEDWFSEEAMEWVSEYIDEFPLSEYDWADIGFGSPDFQVYKLLESDLVSVSSCLYLLISPAVRSNHGFILVFAPMCLVWAWYHVNPCDNYSPHALRSENADPGSGEGDGPNSCMIPGATAVRDATIAKQGHALGDKFTRLWDRTRPKQMAVRLSQFRPWVQSSKKGSIASHQSEKRQSWLETATPTLHANATVAAGTLFVCDWFYSLDAEVGLVWRRRWTLGKTLFLLLRYGTAMYMIFAAYEDTADWRALITGTPALASVSTSLMINHLVATSRKETIHSIFRVIGNYFVFARHLCVFMLGATALYKHCRGHNLRDVEGSGRVSIISTLRRDGAVYYLGITVNTLWACIFFTPGFPTEVRGVGYSGTIQRVVGAILALQLFINIQRSVSEPYSESSFENLSTFMARPVDVKLESIDLDGVEIAERNGRYSTDKRTRFTGPLPGLR
ncbi:hypothetical protein NMY22_g1339 [Coprinellus aureogranulatus]|nr:hypothetical protein NMY22_g1339 [Coprinellus aureogranulatus]